MKLIWEEKDIKAGRKVGRAGSSSRETIGLISGQKTFCLVSSLDWRVGLPKSAGDLAALLNAGEYLPDEMMSILES